MSSFFDSIGNFVMQDVVDPIANVSDALIHGDITGGQYQASGSDYLKTAADVATVASLGLGAGALAGDAGLSIAAPTLVSEAGTGAAEGITPALGFAPDTTDPLAGFLGQTPVTTDTGLPFSGGTVPGGGLTPNAYVGQNFGDLSGVSAPGLSPGATSDPIGYTAVQSSPIADVNPLAGGTTANPIPGMTNDVGGYAQPDVGSATQTSTVAGANPAAPPGKPGVFDTLTNPSNWTLPGVAQAAGLGAAGVGLGAALLKSGAAPPGSQNVSNVAGAATQSYQQQQQTGQALESYLLNSTLPAPMQAQVTDWVNGQKAKVIAGYAARGQNTNPNQNSALQQDLSKVDQNALIMSSQMEAQLFQQGQTALQNSYTALGISSTDYNNLANMSQTQNNQLGTAIASFAGAAAGSTKGPTIQLGGTTTTTKTA